MSRSRDFEYDMRIKENRCEGEFFVECTHKKTAQKLVSDPFKTFNDAKREFIYFYRNKKFSKTKKDNV